MTFVKTSLNVPDIMFFKRTKIRATKYHTLTQNLKNYKESADIIMWKLLKSHKALSRTRLHVTLNLGNSCLIYFNSEIRTRCITLENERNGKTNGSDIHHCNSVMYFRGKRESHNTTRADLFSRILLCYIIWWMNFPSLTESQDSLWCVLESTIVPYSTPLEPKPLGAPLTTKISSNIILVILFRSMKFFLPLRFL